MDRGSRPDSLAGTIIRGGSITSLGTICEKLLAIAQLAIVARLLEPDDFGVFALSVVLLLGLETLTAIGTERMLVHRKVLTSSFIASVYMANLLRGLIVTVFVLMILPLYADWINSERVDEVLLIIAWSPLAVGLLSPNRFLAERQFQFVRIAWFQVLIALLNFTVTVYLAYRLGDVAALAWGQLSMALLASAISWFWFGIPSMKLPVMEELKELLHTGKHYIFIALGTFVTTQADNLIIGGMLGTAILGIYVLAYQISQWPIDLLVKVIGKLLLPAFSRLHGDAHRIWKAFSKSLKVQSLILLPMCVGGVVLAEPLITALLGERYQSAIPVLQILMLLAFSRGMSQYLSLLFLAFERVELASRAKGIEAVAFILFVGSGGYFGGVTGAAAGAAGAYLLGLIVRVASVRRLTHWGIQQMISPMYAALGSSLAAGLVAGLLSAWLNVWAPVELLLLLFVYLLLFGILMLFQDHSVLKEIREALMSGSSTADKERGL